jgi:hypothetical protein
MRTSWPYSVSGRYVTGYGYVLVSDAARLYIGGSLRRSIRSNRDGWGLSMHQDDSPIREHEEEAKTAGEILPGIHRFCHLAGDEKFSVVMIYAFVG